MASERWKRMAEVYLIFAKSKIGDPLYDFSNEAAEDMYLFESGKGERPIENPTRAVFGGAPTAANGYAHGKAAMDLFIAGTIEDHYQGACPLALLFNDPELPDWWIRKVFPNQWSECWDRVAAM